jgi:hypothetical protein
MLFSSWLFRLMKNAPEKGKGVIAILRDLHVILQISTARVSQGGFMG